MEARSLFLDLAQPFLDHQAYLGNCPLFVQAIRLHDLKNEVQSTNYTAPYRSRGIENVLGELPTDLVPVFAMYREACNSRSNFYKFVCYHKIMDGLLGHLRAAINKRARALVIKLDQHKDIVPNDPHIAIQYRSNIGQPIKMFLDTVLTPQFRNAIAHFRTDDGSILNLSAPATMQKYEEIFYVSEVCVRKLIDTHLTLSAQLTAHSQRSA